MVDETHTVFGVVKEATAHALATPSCVKIDMSVPNACSRARGVGDRFTPREGAYLLS